MPVAHQPLAAVIGELVGMAADQGGNLRLDGLRQQRSRAVAQHLGQRIGECSWLGELENISLCHGVSLLRWRSGSFEHPHDTPPYPFMPSPTFVDSSAICTKRGSENSVARPVSTPSARALLRPINGQRARDDDATNEEYRSDRFQRVDHDYGRTTRQLTYSFLRLANLDSSVFERLNRYEATLWRQAVQIIFALQPIKQRYDH